MKKMQKRCAVVGIVLDVLILVWGIWGSFLEIYHYTFGMLAYYTTLSNLFISLGCVFHLIYQLKKFGGREKTGWMQYMKYFGVCCMAITFLMVFLVLAPLGGEGGYYRYLWQGPLKYQHTICPLLAMVSFVLLDSREVRITKAMMRASMIPTVLYAVFSVTCNVLKVMHGPYPFLYVYEQPIYQSILWGILILAAAYGIGWGLYWVNGKVYVTVHCEAVRLLHS
ncbi:MAG: hypothetical protein K2M46_00810 [Lachnospiraceae bacterium]|nr:hypothetical protein [Lachnospiraceae bacterium]